MDQGEYSKLKTLCREYPTEVKWLLLYDEVTLTYQTRALAECEVTRLFDRSSSIVLTVQMYNWLMLLSEEPPISRRDYPILWAPVKVVVSYFYNEDTHELKEEYRDLYRLYLLLRKHHKILGGSYVYL